MPSTDVNCPECGIPLTVSDRATPRRIRCGECGTSFRHEFEESADDGDVPEGWKQSLPIRSPGPILLILAVALATVAIVLVLFWLFGPVPGK